jgi:probable HAF family extracellular repeat protein
VAGINDLGQVVGVDVVSGVDSAFIWDNGVMTALGLGDLPGGASRMTIAYGINNSGWVVGFSAMKNGPDWRAFVWNQADGTRDLNNLLDASGQGWSLQECNGINDAGQIVGEGLNPAGASHAFLLTPVPEPSTVYMLAITVLAAHRRRG